MDFWKKTRSLQVIYYVYIYIIQIYVIFKTIYKNNVFHVFSHLNSLIQNVLPQLKRKGKDNEKFRNDSTKKLLAR